MGAPAPGASMLPTPVQFNVCPHAPICFCNVPVNVRNNNPLLLTRPICRTNSHYYSFYPHAISLWNDLPLSVTSATSLYSNLNQYLSLL